MSFLRFVFRPLGLTGTLVAGVVLVAPLQGATFTVTNTNDSGAGSLRQAILDANVNLGADTIDFSVAGTITLTSGELTITDDLTIDGPGATNLTISGNNASRVIGVGGGTTVTLKDVTIADGISSTGGGIYNDGALTLAHTSVSGNSDTGSGYGGGIYNSPSGTLMVTDSTFSGNSAWGYGGAILNANGVLTITQSTFSGNSATWYGGAISSWVATTNVTNSTFAGNSAGYGGGGGIHSGGGDTLTVTNSTLSGNTTNTVFYGGGGILSFATQLTLRNSIVANSPSGGNCYSYYGPITDGGGNLQYPGTTCGSGIASADPLLDAAGLEDNGGPTKTVALQPGSPAIDAAVGANCPATDQRGVARPQGAGCDIGAYELVQTVAVAVDIKPGSFPNSINTSKRGIIPVAVLGTATFDASTVDPSTVCFGDAEDASQRDCTVAPGTVLEDVNGDGFLDHVVRFENQQTGIDPGDTQACLTGELFDGTSIEGCDSIKAK